MALDREPIGTALFDRLKTALQVKTAGRRLRFWDELSPEDQPALFMVNRDQNPLQRRGLPTRWELGFTVYLYARAEDPADSPGAVLDRMIRQVEAALELQPGETAEAGDFRDLVNVIHTTLGGLVSHARISGTITTDQGALGDQAVAIIPLEALTA